MFLYTIALLLEKGSLLIVLEYRQKHFAQTGYIKNGNCNLLIRFNTLKTATMKNGGTAIPHISC